MAIFTSSEDAAANNRHSAYGFRRATIAYRWHPLFERTLQVSRNRRGKDLTCIYTDERPDLARELPNWMFDENYCSGMILAAWRAGREAETNGVDNLKTFALVEAAYRSAKLGRAVAPAFS